MIFWIAVTTQLRSHGTLYERVYVEYGHLQLHHQTSTVDTD
jgi:hypothetical protein